ncbi:hypothetical protein [Cupriavidus pauculus]|uniref:hypothetical protein n=1 Tax=Cupriavidus pauculus TaxID=82633 RepID=UPI001FD05A42|nr:hypothetical protein [Cupriavidus pauculus]
MSITHARSTSFALVALVVILFVALFFIVTTPQLALLYVQLSALAPMALLVVALWTLSNFEHLLGRPA